MTIHYICSRYLLHFGILRVNCEKIVHIFLAVVHFQICIFHFKLQVYLGQFLIVKMSSFLFIFYYLVVMQHAIIQIYDLLKLAEHFNTRLDYFNRLSLTSEQCLLSCRLVALSKVIYMLRKKFSIAEKHSDLVTHETQLFYRSRAFVFLLVKVWPMLFNFSLIRAFPFFLNSRDNKFQADQCNQAYIQSHILRLIIFRLMRRVMTFPKATISHLCVTSIVLSWIIVDYFRI